MDKTNENNEAKKVGEEELEQVAGGSGDGEKCFFYPKGLDASFYEKQGADPSYVWLKCTYSGAGCWGCACHGRPHCVDCWHKVEASTDARLLPRSFANHGLKSFTKNYSEPKLP